MSERSDFSFVGLALVVLATVCWSTSGIFITHVSNTTNITPVGLAFWRDLATFLCFLIGLLIFKPQLLRVKRRDIPWLAAMGAISIGAFHVLWNTSIVTIGVSVSTIVQANSPIFVTIMAFIFWREPLTARKWIAIALATAGMVLISQPQNLVGTDITITGLLISLGAALTYGSFSIFGKRMSADYSQVTILTYVFGFASLVLLPFQVGKPLPSPLNAQALGGFVALVLFTTMLGFGLYTSSLRRLQASIASITSNTEVPFAALLSFIILGERLDIWQLIGAVLIVGGVVLISLPRRHTDAFSKPTKQPEPDVNTI